MRLRSVIAAAVLPGALCFFQTGFAQTGEPTGSAGVLQGRHYRHNLTGTQFDLPAGWRIGITRPVDGDPREMTVLRDPDGRTIFTSVAMSKVETPPASINEVLTRAVPQLVAGRAGRSPPMASRILRSNRAASA